MVVERVFGATPFGMKATRSWRRSLVKTLTWRLFATADTFLISALITGNLRWAGSIVGVEFATKMAWYFLHERAWAYARVGVEAPPCAAPVSHTTSFPLENLSVPWRREDDRLRGDCAVALAGQMEPLGFDAVESSRLLVLTAEAARGARETLRL